MMTSLASISQRIATEIAARENQVVAAVQLLDEGATVPFIARYRKEVTGGLDDTQLRTLEERLGYLRELEERRTAILAAIEEQGKLTPALRGAIALADDKARLEDLYLPYKLKRRTKAQIAKEAGLEPLADSLLSNPLLVPEVEAAKYLKEPFKSDDGDNPGVSDAKAALEGARQILMERFAEDADLAGQLREYLLENGVVDAKVVEGKAEEGAKFADYFAYTEKLKSIPSHRALALLRGRREQFLQIALRLESEPERPVTEAPFNDCETRIAARNGIDNRQRAADRWLFETVRWTWRIKLATRLETELFTALRDRAETEAIRVFGMNLKDLLLAAPAGACATIGLDPGLRTGVKVAVTDATGKLVETATIYPHAPRNDWDASIALLASLGARHKAQLISIGNGTASRETDKLAGELIKKHPELGLKRIVVSEAGASVYSASEFAAKEFPDLDVSLRGAVSIARRLQDPLAELVKIDPKSIGVGQYQHDVNQAKLARTLTAIVEDCVNAVGVDVNTASVALLSRVSGLNASIAQNIVSHRDANGRFNSRNVLKKVPRFGEKTFEQAAGFLRITDGSNPLDASAVHPEAYPVVERILAAIGRDAKAVIGDSAALKALNPAKFADDKFGIPTVTDILRELEKPGRDPRPEFKTATFREGIEGLKDLQVGMVLEGVITNVTNFGAFVDIGVHQDGLVHISALSNKFVKDPREVVKTGDLVRVKVLEVDEKRKRIALSMKLNDAAEGKVPPKVARSVTPGEHRPAARGAATLAPKAPVAADGAMALAFARLKRG
jgi:protein Tex